MRRITPVSRTGKTLSQELEARLRADIISGVLKPRDRLRVNNLAVQHGVSATPIREALQHLAAQGLVHIDPQAGARVASVNLEEMSDLYSVRAMVEAEATRRAILRGGLDWLAKVMNSWEELKVLETTQSSASSLTDAGMWISAHREFHRTILSACGSPLLLRFIETLYDHSARYQSVLRGNPVFVLDSPTEHAELVEAVLRRDADKAAGIIETQLALASVRLLSDLGGYPEAVEAQ